MIADWPSRAAACEPLNVEVWLSAKVGQKTLKNLVGCESGARRLGVPPRTVGPGVAAPTRLIASIAARKDKDAEGKATTVESTLAIVCACEIVKTSGRASAIRTKERNMRTSVTAEFRENV